MELAELTDWKAILDEHGKAVWNTAYRLLGNDADAADCFQETFADALIFSRKQSVKNYRSVLLKFATCRAMDVLRQRMRKNQPVLLDETDEISLQSRDCPQGSAENDELGRLLVKAFAQLDSEEAEIFCLKHIENLSATEIAQIFRLKENHVCVIVHRARNKLRVLLHKAAFDNSKT
ncbi:MAG: sigma-70 family RNA polymerase sigma factor [Phycisphaerales bacterium]